MWYVRYKLHISKYPVHSFRLHSFFNIYDLWYTTASQIVPTKQNYSEFDISREVEWNTVWAKMNVAVRRFMLYNTLQVERVTTPATCSNWLRIHANRLIKSLMERYRWRASHNGAVSCARSHGWHIMQPVHCRCRRCRAAALLRRSAGSAQCALLIAVAIAFPVKNRRHRKWNQMQSLATPRYAHLAPIALDLCRTKTFYFLYV